MNPVKDSDGDGIIDEQDACPEIAGSSNLDPKKHGCPEPEQLANLDINKQTQQAEDFMTKGVDVLMMTPVNEEGVVPILRKAKADGTPVVLEGNPAKGMTTLFAICDYDAGFKAGDAVGRILVSRGESEARVMDVGLPLLSATVLRSLGFMEALAQHVNAVKVHEVPEIANLLRLIFTSIGKLIK